MHLFKKIEIDTSSGIPNWRGARCNWVHKSPKGQPKNCWITIPERWKYNFSHFSSLLSSLGRMKTNADDILHRLFHLRQDLTLHSQLVTDYYYSYELWLHCFDKKCIIPLFSIDQGIRLLNGQTLKTVLSALVTS